MEHESSRLCADGCTASKTDDNKISYVEGPRQDSEEYDMTHKQRGLAIIFNHFEFKDGTKGRSGTKKDAANLLIELKSLGFTVKQHENLDRLEILKELDTASKQDFTDADCLVVIVLTHGDPEILYAADTYYRVSDLWQPFYGDVCPTLAAKPKIFIIQACRGSGVDSGVRLHVQRKTEVDGAPRGSYTIPRTADILVAYSTFDGYYAWRNPEEGSWYIQTLCTVLSKHGKEQDILRLLTTVNRKVAIEYESYVPRMPDMHKKKQMPSFYSTLTRLVYFRPKNKNK